MFGWFFIKQWKNNAVLELRTGNFQELVGLEARAKDLSFKVKAKNFKTVLEPKDILEDSTSGWNHKTNYMVAWVKTITYYDYRHGSSIKLLIEVEM